MRLGLRLALLALVMPLLSAACTPTAAPPQPIVPATINRDCAPWDGPAFTILVPQAGGDQVIISIWSAPDFRGRTTHTFAKDPDRVGSAGLRDPAGNWRPLTGTAVLGAVQPGQPVQGEYRLLLATGEVFSQSFLAEWESLQALCG
jgi:hypothetical protein